MTIMKKIILTFILSFSLFSTLPVFAQIKPPTSNDPIPADSGTTKPCISGCTDSGKSSDINIAVRLKNPLKVNDINEAIRWFVNVLMKIIAPFIVIFFIWSGFRFVWARGKPDEIKKAKDMFLWTVIGTLLILGAWVITNAIIGTVNSISS